MIIRGNDDIRNIPLSVCMCAKHPGIHYVRTIYSFQRMHISAITYDKCSLVAAIKHCAGVTCLNGGTCNDRPHDDFKCRCAIGYTGIYCETSGFLAALEILYMWIMCL